jgi:hypothetical protein
VPGLETSVIAEVTRIRARSVRILVILTITDR